MEVLCREQCNFTRSFLEQHRNVIRWNVIARNDRMPASVMLDLLFAPKERNPFHKLFSTIFESQSIVILKEITRRMKTTSSAFDDDNGELRSILWKFISRNENIDADFLAIYEDYVHWNLVSRHCRVWQKRPRLLRRYASRIDWLAFVRRRDLRHFFNAALMEMYSVYFSTASH